MITQYIKGEQHYDYKKDHIKRSRSAYGSSTCRLLRKYHQRFLQQQLRSEAGSSAADTSAADSSAADSTASDSTASKLDTDITVVSREDGSGTRGAFVELMGIEQKNEAGEKEDMTRGDAEISNSTNGVMMSVAGNVDAIGYISLGSLNDTVKALDVNGVERSVPSLSAMRSSIFA